MWVMFVVHICATAELTMRNVGPLMWHMRIYATLGCLFMAFYVAWASWNFACQQWRLIRAEHNMAGGAQGTQHEAVYIEESPVPTRTFSSPWPRSSTRRPRSARQAQRAGARRVKVHRRHQTLRYNPKRLGECGFESVLYISGISINRGTLQALRHMTAEVIHKKYVEDW